MPGPCAWRRIFERLGSHFVREPIEAETREAFDVAETSRAVKIDNDYKPLAHQSARWHDLVSRHSCRDIDQWRYLIYGDGGDENLKGGGGGNIREENPELTIRQRGFTI